MYIVQTKRIGAEPVLLAAVVAEMLGAFWLSMQPEWRASTYQKMY